LSKEFINITDFAKLMVISFMDVERSDIEADDIATCEMDISIRLFSK
jgi:hypothetical protein